MPRICLSEEGEGEAAKLAHNIFRLPIISTICTLDNLCTLPEFVAIRVEEPSREAANFLPG
jgi:hypothetical protein